jgi:hypothetical protein
MKSMRMYFRLLMVLTPLSYVMPFTIMLDPAGHAQQTGRKLWSGFERAETFKCAEALKGELEEYSSETRIILTRAPGEEIVPLQNASFANRLNVDFFLRIQCIKADTAKPHLTLYYHEIDPLIDNAQHSDKPYTFTPLHQAHFRSIHRSSEIARALKNYLGSTDYQKDFDCFGVYGLPLKSLMGITIPAVVLEIGLCSDDQWKLFIDPLVQGLGTTLNLTNGQS